MKNAICIFITASLLSFWNISIAQSIFNAPASFEITQSCQATNSIRNPDNKKHVKQGEVYKAIGHNKAIDPTHILLTINNKNYWLALNCGKLRGDTPSPIAHPDIGENENTQSGCPVFLILWIIPLPHIPALLT